LIALADMHFENDLQSSVIEHGNRNVVFIFGILGVLLLVIASINYVNLATARASLRAKEVSIKKIKWSRQGPVIHAVCCGVFYGKCDLSHGYHPYFKIYFTLI
jgi:hypothetical protein